MIHKAMWKLIGILFLGLCGLGSAAVVQADSPTTEVIQVVVSDHQHVVLRVQAPDILPAALPDNPAYARLEVPGASYLQIPGAPALPYFDALLALPPGATTTATVLDSTCQAVAGNWRIVPAPQTDLDMTGPDGIARLAQDGPRWTVTQREDPQIYDQRVNYPAEMAALGASQTMRGWRLVAVHLFPWQVVPAANRMRFCPDITVSIVFSNPAPPSPAEPLSEPAFEPILAGAVLNWDLAQSWRERAPDLPAPITPWSAGLRMTVSGSGIVRLTYTALAAAGAPVVTLDPATLRVLWREQELAIEVTGADDGHFDPEDEVRFYAAAQESRYMRTAIYWLRWGGSNGLRMTTHNATPSGTTPEITVYTRTLRLEQDQEYRSTMLGLTKDDDHWFYADEIYPRPGLSVDTKTHNFVAADAAGVPGVQVNGRFGGGDPQSANPDSWVGMWLNGQSLGSFSWDGRVIYTATVNLPATTLITTTNVLTVQGSLAQIPGAIAYYVVQDWYSIRYVANLQAAAGRLDVQEPAPGLNTHQVAGFGSTDVLAYDVSNPLQPVRLTGLDISTDNAAALVRFEVESSHLFLIETSALAVPDSLILVNSPDLRSASLGADWLLIGPADLLSAAQPLLAQRQAQGLRVASVDVQDIFDQFAGGHREPQALYDFLYHAYFFWQQPAPSYVVLLGDGQYDFRNDTGYSLPNPIPPYMAPVDPFIIETVTDHALVTVDGPPGDVLPDMHIGRLPVNTFAEAQDIVSKTLVYAAAPGGLWQSQATYTADRQPDPAGAGDFHTISNDIITWLSAEMTPQRIYIGAQSYAYPDGATANAVLLGALSNGEFYTQYFGHGSQYRWGRVSADVILRVANEPILPVRTDLPLIAEWGCWTGYFVLVNNPAGTLPLHSLGETLAKTPAKGAIADISATGLHTAPPLQVMARGLHKALFTDRIAQAGAANSAMKVYLFSSTGITDVLETTVFFGDPALALRLPEGDLSASSAHISAPLIQPGESLTVTATVTNSSIFTLTQPNVVAAFPSLLLTSASANGGVVSDDQIVWTLADLAPGASQSVAAVLTATTAIAPGSYPITVPLQLGSRMAPTVTLTLTSALQATADLTPSSLTADRAWAAPGQAVTFTLVISNAGNMTSPQTWLTATLPAGLAAPLWLTATAPTAFYDDASRQVRWQGPVAPASPVTVSFSSVISSTLSACGAISLPADLTDAWGNTLGRAAAINLAVPDVNCDGVVNIIDVQSVALRFGALPGDPWYDPHYDLDADGVIGVLDITLVASRWQAAPAG